MVHICGKNGILSQRRYVPYTANRGNQAGRNTENRYV